MIRIRAERLRKGWSQLKLATMAKVHPSDVSRYESGHPILAGHRHRLAEVLGIPEGEILDEVDLEVVDRDPR